MNNIRVIRVAQFSDLHYANETLDEVDRCFGSAVEQAIRSEAQVGVISGDSTDHRLDAHSPALSTLARRVCQLADAMPVLMLQGTFSHEPPGTLDVFGMLGGRHPIFVADRICQVALVDGAWIASTSWRFTEDELRSLAAREQGGAGIQLLVSCLPTVNKAAVAAVVGVANAAEAIGEHIAALLAGFGQINAIARSLGLPTIGVSHGTVSGCITEHGVPMAGLDHEFGTGSLFSAGCSAFLLGHIHKHQDWELQDGAGVRRIAYPGSIGRLHYGEIGAKGWLLWTVEAGGSDFQLNETPSRRMVDLEFTGVPDMAAISQSLANCKDAFVRVRWNVDEEHRDCVDREAIEAALKQGGAAAVKLEGRVIPIVRTRAEGMNQAGSDAEKLAKWCEVTGTAVEGLSERLQALASNEPEAIAEQVLADAAA